MLYVPDPDLPVQDKFVPSKQLEELSCCQGFSMEAAVNSVLSGSLNATISISVGPLAGQRAVSTALSAPIHHYILTQGSYLSALVGPRSLISNG